MVNASNMLHTLHIFLIDIKHTHTHTGRRNVGCGTVSSRMHSRVVQGLGMSVPSVESSDGHPLTIVVGLKSLERVIAVTVFNFRIHAHSDIVVCTCTYVLFLFRIFLLKENCHS